MSNRAELRAVSLVERRFVTFPPDLNMNPCPQRRSKQCQGIVCRIPEDLLSLHFSSIQRIFTYKCIHFLRTAVVAEPSSGFELVVGGCSFRQKRGMHKLAIAES